MNTFLIQKDYQADREFHQTLVDAHTRLAVTMQTALLYGTEAKIIGTMTQPHILLEDNKVFWEEFQRALVCRNIHRVEGRMPRKLAEHYKQHYGMHEIGMEEDIQSGQLVVLERQL